MTGLNRFHNLEVDLLFGEFIDAGLPHPLVKLPGGTIQNRHLGTININQTVGNACKVEGCHQMLNGGDRCTILGNQGGKPGIGHLIITGRNLNTIHHKNNPLLTAGQKFKIDRVTGMQADAGKFKDTVDGGLAFDHRCLSHDFGLASTKRCFNSWCSLCKASYFCSKPFN